MRCASIGVGVFFSCRESGVQASRMRVDCVDGWIWVVRLVSSRLVWWRVVSCRVVRGGIVIRMVGG